MWTITIPLPAEVGLEWAKQDRNSYLARLTSPQKHQEQSSVRRGITSCVHERYIFKKRNQTTNSYVPSQDYHSAEGSSEEDSLDRRGNLLSIFSP